MGITLITPTGDRPQAFELCEKYMSTQTIKWNQWIVIDDGFGERTKCTLNQDYIILPPVDCHTIKRNIAMAIKYVKYDHVIIIEDDDWYSPMYLQTMSNHLKHFELVGIKEFIYYNIITKRYKIHPNRHHSPLCATAFNKSIVPHVSNALNVEKEKYNYYTTDRRIWNEIDCSRNLVISNHCIGIKGLPGRKGTDEGRTDTYLDPLYKDDSNLDMFRALLCNDVTNYQEYMK